MKVLISLVGGRPLPNVLVALHCRPDAIYFVVSKDSVGAGRDFEKTLQALPAHLQPCDRRIVEPYLMEDSTSACLQFARLHPDAELVLNATLGPKTMAFGMYEAARELKASGRQVDICYLGGDRLFWVLSGETEQVKIGLKQYFDSYGWNVEPKQDFSLGRLENLAALFIQNLDIAAQLLRLMRNSDKGKGKRTIHCAQRLSEDQFILLKAIEKLGFVINVQCSDKGTSWTIPNDEDGKFLLSGEWLEYHTYLTAKGLSEKDNPLFFECGWGVEDAARKGEIDFAGITGGQLIIASCKTESSIERAFLEELYGKAEQLGKGMCSTLLISTASKASRTPKDVEQYARWSRERQIVIAFAEDIPRLDQILRKIALGNPSAEPADIPCYPRI